ASSPDTNNANNTATATTSVSNSPSADLRIAKSDSPDPINSGGTLTYTINVSNDSPVTSPDITTANHVGVTDPPPAGTTFVSCTSTQGGACPTTLVGNTVTMNLGSLPPTGIATVTIQATVTAPAGSGLANTASVSSSTPDPNPANNNATATTTVTA